MIGMRVVLVVLGVLLGIALLAHGNVVIGALILAMAAVRGAMVFRMHQRRETFRQRRAAFRERRQARFGRTTWPPPGPTTTPPEPRS